MQHRRSILKSSLITSISLLTLPRLQLPSAQASTKNKPPYNISRHVPTKMYDGKRCWCHPRAGIVPNAGTNRNPRVIMTMNTLHVSGSDIFKAVHSLETNDLGQHWTKPTPSSTLAIRHETINDTKHPVAVCDFWPTWHAASKTLLGTGHTVAYTPKWKIPKKRSRHTCYATYNPATSQWSTWKNMIMPPGKLFNDAGAGCTQRYDLPDSSILLPIYFRPPNKNSRVTIAHCTFDGSELKFKTHGNILSIDDKTRGLHEPSITYFQGTYFLTIRNDKRAFITTSKDGLNFKPMQTWKFDDGKDLGNYNTQQHWVTHSDALYLVYTRKGANNDHVFRHRAPLFIAQVNPKTLRVIRDTEQILIPERGARLGNFGITQVSPNETWVTVSEWMQTWGPNYIMPVNNKYGSDGSVHVAKILWNKPNKNFS